MTDSKEPALSWSPPEEQRRALLAAREGLREAEATLVTELVTCFRALVEKATPADRLALVDIYTATSTSRGQPEVAARLRAAWAACEAAHGTVVQAEDALQRALPPTIDIVLAPSPPSPDSEEPSP